MFDRAPRATTLHERFERQVALRPRATALECDGVRLTYREMNQDSNRMARRLVAARVGADGLVLLAMERSCELVVTMLAVLKAGGAFIVMDGALTGVEQDAFIKASGAEVVVTDSIRGFANKRLRVVRYFAAAGADQNLDQRTQSDRWACVAAGKVRSHETVLKMLDAARREHAFRPGDGMFSALELAGQAGIDLFLPLIAGGRLVLASPLEMRDPERLEAASQASNCRLVRLPKTQPLSLAPSPRAASA